MSRISDSDAASKSAETSQSPQAPPWRVWGAGRNQGCVSASGSATLPDCHHLQRGRLVDMESL
nr:MAG TPA: hypothetical protein [Caudoviricetes sp.]